MTLVPMKFCTNSFMRQGKGNLPIFVYITLTWTSRFGILTVNYKTFMKTRSVHKWSYKKHHADVTHALTFIHLSVK